MTVKRKAARVTTDKDDIDKIIYRGGKTTVESKQIQEQLDEEVRFTLRIPQSLINKIDQSRQSRVGNVSRNQWIIEAIASQIK